jgi:hypothetical protein
MQKVQKNRHSEDIAIFSDIELELQIKLLKLSLIMIFKNQISFY